MVPSSSSPSDCSGSIADMNHDHLFSILRLLPLDAIIYFSMTCKKLRSLASCDFLWESLCRRDFGDGLVGSLLASSSSEQGRRLSWKRLYEKISCPGSLSCRRVTCKDGIFPRPRDSHSLNFVSDCLVLFGGCSETGQLLDDTWLAYIGSEFTGVIGWQKVNSGNPSGRFGHSCTVVDDALILFGGYNGDESILNDTWIGQVIHQGSFKVEISWRPLDVGPIAPPPRGRHAACCAGNKRIVITGGMVQHGFPLDGTWLLDISDDLTSGRWREIAYDFSLSPLPRLGHSMTWIGGNHIILLGGRDLALKLLHDYMWLLNIGEEQPKWVPLYHDSRNIQGEIPLARADHSAALAFGGRLLVYGGECSRSCSEDGSFLHLEDDFWILDISALSRFQTMNLREPSRKMWKELKIKGHRPKSRSWHGACTDKSGRYIFLYGGELDEPEPCCVWYDKDLYLVELVPQF